MHIPSFPPSKTSAVPQRRPCQLAHWDGGRLGPLSLVVPPPVKFRNTDEHWEPLIDSSIFSSGGVGPLLGSGPRARMSWQLPRGTETSSSLLCEQLGAHSVFSSQQLSMDMVLVFLPIVFFFFKCIIKYLLGGHLTGGPPRVFHFHMSGNRALIYPLSWEQYPFLTVCRDNIWLLFKHLSVKIKPTLFLVTLLRFLEMPEMSFQTCKLEPKPSPVMWAQTNPFVLFLFIDMHLCLPRSFSLKKIDYFHSEPHQSLPTKQRSHLKHWRRMLMKP